MLRATTSMLVVLALAVALPVAGASAAAHAVAPPGNSEADQYYETLPATNGARAPDTTKKAGDAVRDGSLSEASERALRGRGPRGLALATAVARTAPPGTVSHGGGGPPLAPAARVEPPSEPGMGALFPVLLAATAAAALGFAVHRRQGGGGSRRRGRPAR
jgi:hypothetical protein